VEDVASRAGVARATVYQHFGSRMGLVDAICDSLDENPALLATREAIALPDVDDALAAAIANSVRFWASEEAVLDPLYGAAAVDSAAHDLVERQNTDRRREFERLLRRLAEGGRLRPGVSRRKALAELLLLTSFPTFRELRRHAGLAERDVAALLQDGARTLLLPG
jgi:AcrR family transcriptional regulator